MFISRKRWEALEKRVADLEKLQSQPIADEISPLEKMKVALKELSYPAPQLNQTDTKDP